MLLANEPDEVGAAEACDVDGMAGWGSDWRTEKAEEDLDQSQTGDAYAVWIATELGSAIEVVIDPNRKRFESAGLVVDWGRDLAVVCRAGVQC